MTSHKFYLPIGMPNLPQNPASPQKGDTYYNTVTNKVLTWDGTKWSGGAGSLDAGVGLVGGGSMSDNISIAVNPGTGLKIVGDTIALNTTTTDGLYVKKAGDAMVGALTVNAPTVLGHAARYMDGVPSFANAGTRNTSYPASPGEGKISLLRDVNRLEVYRNSSWEPIPIKRWMIRLWRDTGFAAPADSQAPVVWQHTGDYRANGYLLPSVVSGATAVVVPATGVYMVAASSVTAGSTTTVTRAVGSLIGTPFIVHVQLPIVKAAATGSIAVSGTCFLTAGTHLQWSIGGNLKAFTYLANEFSMYGPL